MARTSRSHRAGGLPGPFVVRWAALLILGVAVFACNSDLPGSRSVGSETEAGAEATTASPVTTRLAEDRTPRGNEPRGEWETRLWIGIWCDRDSHRGDPPFRVEIDGVQMMETRSTCRNYVRPPHNPPNGGFLGFTLNQGPHVLAIYGPDGAPYRRDLSITDDTWVIIDYEVEEGTPVYSVRTRNVPLSVDTTYDPATRPVSAAEAENGRPAPVAGNSVPTTTSAEGFEAGPPDGVDGDPNSGSDDDQEWLSAGDSRSGSSRSASSRSGSSRSGSSRGESDEGWVEGNPGYLSVESARPVRVYVDGAQIGESPLRRHMLNAGAHRVLLRADGDFERRFNVTIESGRNYSLVNDR